MKKLFEEKYFGKINHFHYEFGSKGGWTPMSGYNVDRKRSGGGVLVVTGTHFLDRMLYWFGEPEKFIYSDDSYGGVEANCKAELFYNNNLGDFSGSFFMSKTVGLKNVLFIDTEKYRVELGESDYDKITLFPKNNPELKMELSSRKDTNKKGKNYFQIQVDEFADNVRYFKEITVDGWFAAKSMKLIEEMYNTREQLEEPWLIYKNKTEKINV